MYSIGDDLTSAIGDAGGGPMSQNWTWPIRLFHRPLAELPRQRAAMHAELARRFRDVEAGRGERLVDPLPFERLDRGRPRADRLGGIALGLAERGLDIVGVWKAWRDSAARRA